MKLSIIIPVYNEEATILEVLRQVMHIDIGTLAREVIVINDSSTDGTGKVLEAKAKKLYPSLKVYHHAINQGKGAALRTGFDHATGDIIIVQDADLEYHPSDIPIVIEPILRGETQVVYGSRLIDPNVKMYWLHYIGNQVLTMVTNVLYLTKITDMETGYKAFTKEVKNKLHLRANRFDFEPEITAKIIKAGYTIKEIPIKFSPRTFEEGKKITWRDGMKALWYLIKYRFVD